MHTDENERLYLSRDYRCKAAHIVEEQLLEHPELGIPVDPDIAEHMGPFLDESVASDYTRLADLEGDGHEA